MYHLNSVILSHILLISKAIPELEHHRAHYIIENN